jgi:SAM-dependent methyltransferase
VTVLGRLHGGLVFPRRIAVLGEVLAPLLPPGSRVLDLGCGDGLLARAIEARRPDLTIRGADVLVREGAQIPVDPIVGGVLPYGNREFEAVLIVDVLHHTFAPEAVLREALRVSTGTLVVKDHLRDPWLGAARLRIMDFVGNAHHGVALTYNYWTRARWEAAFRELGLSTEGWIEDIGLYPWPASWLFGRGLHFVARLRGAG